MKTYDKEERYLQAKKRVEKVKAFYHHLLWYTVVNLSLLIWIAMSVKWNGREFWNLGTFSTAIFWGIGLVFHGANIFVFGREWEKRKIRKFMEKENRRMWK